jgi:hypothetical protein
MTRAEAAAGAHCRRRHLSPPRALFFFAAEK